MTPGFGAFLFTEASTDICWRQNLNVGHFLDAHFKFSVKKEQEGFRHYIQHSLIYQPGKFYVDNSKEPSLSTKLVCFHVWVHRINPALSEKRTQITATYTPCIHSPRKTRSIKQRGGIWSSVLLQMERGLEKSREEGESALLPPAKQRKELTVVGRTPFSCTTAPHRSRGDSEVSRPSSECLCILAGKKRWRTLHTSVVTAEFTQCSTARVSITDRLMAQTGSQQLQAQSSEKGQLNPHKWRWFQWEQHRDT